MNSMTFKAIPFTIMFLLATPGFGNFSENRGVMPLGELEAFMGNTGVALSGSTGAVAYNPAGLAGIQQSRLSLSANSYMKLSSKMEPVETFDGTDLNFKSSSIQGIPNAFVSTWSRENTTYAFSILVPYQLKLEDALGYSSPSYPTMQLSRTNYFQLIMAGLSFGTRFENNYDIGAGCFYTMYQSAQMNAFTANTNGGTNALISNSFFRSEVNGLYCNMGIQKQFNDDWRFGLTARLPFIRMSNKGRASTFIQNPNNGVSESVGPQTVEADFKLPLDLGFGTEYRINPTTFAYLDINYQLGESYSTGDLNTLDVETEDTARFSGGISYQATPTIRVLGGVAYNPSTTKRTVDSYTENFTIATVGANYTVGNSSLGVGLMYGTSSGKSDATIYDASLNEIGQKEGKVQSDVFGVLISSGFIF